MKKKMESKKSLTDWSDILQENENEHTIRF